jgi:hypothetical protein
MKKFTGQYWLWGVFVFGILFWVKSLIDYGWNGPIDLLWPGFLIALMVAIYATR